MSFHFFDEIDKPYYLVYYQNEVVIHFEDNLHSCLK